MAQISSLPLSLSVLTKALNARNPFEAVLDTAQNYNSPFLTIVHALNNWNSEQIDTEKYERGKLGNLAIATTIGAAAQSGSNLVLTLSDATFNQFRVGDKVMDSNRYFGWVTTASAGSVTIQPFISGALTAGTQFAAGMTIKCVANASAKRASGGVESLYVTPDVDFNFYSVKRDSVFLAGEDFVDTYVKMRGKHWAFAQEYEMLRRLSVSIEQDMVWSQRGQVTTTQGVTNSNGGLEYSIKNRNGTYIPATSAITLAVLNEVIYNVRIKQGKPTQELTFLMGSGAMQQVQVFLGDFVHQSGVNNTFGGGSVKGFNVKTYSIADVNCKFIYAPVLDNDKMWPEGTSVPGLIGSKMSNSFFVLDTSPAPIYGGGTEPIVKLFHFGKEMSFGHINGMVAAGGDPSDYMNPADTVISSDTDGITAHAMVKNGINIVDASGMAFYEMVI